MQLQRHVREKEKEKNDAGRASLQSKSEGEGGRERAGARSGGTLSDVQACTLENTSGMCTTDLEQKGTHELGVENLRQRRGLES